MNIDVRDSDSKVKVGDQFIATSNDYHIKQKDIAYHKVPYRLFADSSGKQYLYNVDKSSTRIDDTREITDKPYYEEIQRNFRKDIRFIANKLDKED